MTALSLATLGGGGPAAALPRISGPGSVALFQDSLARQGALDPADTVAPATAATPVTPPAGVASPADGQPVRVDATTEAGAADRDRVRRTLELDGTKPAPSSGDTILGGIQKLRGVFDDRHTRISGLMHSDVMNMNALMSMQMEVAQYTILVDVSSKLTGKTTQSLDTLMKGQ